jgi:hypothetical protein
MDAKAGDEVPRGKGGYLLSCWGLRGAEDLEKHEVSEKLKEREQDSQRCQGTPPIPP